MLQRIDQLVDTYHHPQQVAARQEVLYHLRLAIQFWMKKLKIAPANVASTALSSTGLSAAAKVNGLADGLCAVNALFVVVNAVLRSLTGVKSDVALRAHLMRSYGAANAGLVADEQRLAQLAPASNHVSLTNRARKPSNELRFRTGVAWRWNAIANAYAPFDTLDNRESAINDQKVHFAMDQRGRIYCGFDKTMVWFKHSTLIGGGTALSAGRMRVDGGIVTLIENDSGHYSPNHLHMRNLLQRLRVHGMNLSHTQIERHSDHHVFTADAVLNALNGWPDGWVGH